MFAAYVNPRTTRLASISQMNGEIVLHNRTKFNTAEFDSLETILQRYFRRNEGRGGVLAIAAPGVEEGETRASSQLPWPIHAALLAEQFDFASVQLYDEPLATARGVFELRPEKLFTINHGAKSPIGNVGLMAVDSGLEEVLMVRSGTRYCTFLSDGGSTGFGPSTQLEAELWQHLYAQREMVEVRDVVGYGGLVRIYEFLLENRGHDVPSWYAKAEDRATRIVEMALSGADAPAEGAVDLLVDCLAVEAANFALRGVTTGGLYLAGRLTTELIPALDQGQFLDNFLQRGAAEARLRGIPIYVIMDRNTALLGAARLALESGCPE